MPLTGDNPHQRNTRDHEQQLDDRTRDFFGIFVELRNEIGPRDVEEVTGGEREQPLLDPFDAIGGDGDDDHADDRTQRGKEIEEERFRSRVTAVEQDGKVADLLRDLVQDHGRRRRDAERNIDQVRRRDERTVDDVVDGVPEQDELPDGMNMLFTLRVVAVVPVDELFDRERDEDAREDDQ